MQLRAWPLHSGPRARVARPVLSTGSQLVYTHKTVQTDHVQALAVAQHALCHRYLAVPASRATNLHTTSSTGHQSHWAAGPTTMPMLPPPSRKGEEFPNDKTGEASRQTCRACRTFQPRGSIRFWLPWCSSRYTLWAAKPTACSVVNSLFSETRSRLVQHQHRRSREPFVRGDSLSTAAPAKNAGAATGRAA